MHYSQNDQLHVLPGTAVCRLSRARVLSTRHTASRSSVPTLGLAARNAFLLSECILGTRTGQLLGNGQREVDLTQRLRTIRRITSLLVTPWQAEPVDSDSEVTHEATMPRGPIVITTVGRVAPQKGVRFFLDVVNAATLALSADGIAAEWHWLGGGTPDEEDRLQRGGVRVSGWLPRTQVLEQLRLVSVYVHTAEWEAAYPLSLMEAARLGLPLVVRRIPALEDLPFPLAVRPSEAAAQIRALADAPAWARARTRTNSWVAGLRSSRDSALTLQRVYEACAPARGWR